MREGDYTLLANPGLSKFELYNLRSDVKQTTDLVQKEPARLEAMKKALQKLNAEIEAEGPTWWKGKELAPKKKDVKKIDKLSLMPRSGAGDMEAGTVQARPIGPAQFIGQLSASARGVSATQVFELGEDAPISPRTRIAPFAFNGAGREVT